MNFVDYIYHFFLKSLIVLSPKFIFNRLKGVIVPGRKQKPIIIYQMGKVGSTSVYDSIWKTGLPVYHFHKLNVKAIAKIEQNHIKQGREIPKHFKKSKKAYFKFVNNQTPLFIISAVRDPIARNISAFFQNFQYYIGPDRNIEKQNISYLTEVFLEKYNHCNALNWFDNEMKGVFGVDVFDFEFPKDKGYQLIQEKQLSILLFKIEINDAVKEELIKEFLDLKKFKLIKANVGENKEYSNVYKKYKNEVILPESYIDMMLNSKYVKHFYSDLEIQRLRMKWTK